MKRRLLMIALAAGATLGFASGFRHVRECRHARHDAQQRQIAKMCADAAVRARTPDAPTAGKRGSHPDHAAVTDTAREESGP